MESVRADFDSFRDVNLGHHLGKYCFGALLPGFNRCHGIFIARDNAQIAQLPAEHHIQRHAMQLCVIEGKLESTA